MTTTDELRQAAANVRDQKFADLIAFALELAVEIYPEELREAISKVFAMDAIPAELDKQLEYLRSIWRHIKTTEARADGLEKRLANLETMLEQSIGRLMTKLGEPAKML